MTTPKRILALSSHVAHGHVGLSAATPIWHAMGHEVMALATVLLSNRPGYLNRGGTIIDPSVLRDMVDALEQNGWLSGVDAVALGYLPSPGHVAVARDAVRRVRGASPQARVLVDPVLGDDHTGLYIDEAAARAIAVDLLECADVVTPNAFEACWLASALEATGADGKPCPISDVGDVQNVARRLGVPAVVVTSVLSRDDGRVMHNVLVEADQAVAYGVAKRAGVHHGLGDLFAALVIGHAVRSAADRDLERSQTEGARAQSEGGPYAEPRFREPPSREPRFRVPTSGWRHAVARAVAGVDVIVAHSAGAPEPVLIPHLAACISAGPASGEPV
ncbi:MAG: pyridoxal kinase [Pseudomonadota bacterium]